MSAAPVLRQVLAETEALLARAELELRRLEDRVRALQVERQGLQLALVRHGTGVGEPATPTPAGGTGPGGTEGGGGAGSVAWRELSRAEAVLQVLLAEGRPVSRREIVGALADAGRGDDADAVSAALAYLRRTGKARRVGPAQWSSARRETGTVGTPT